MNHYRRAALAFGFAFGIALTAHAQEAAPLFKSKCAICHGPDGKGNTPIAKKFGAKNLAATSLKESEVADAITKGIPESKMPGFKGKLSPEEIDRLAHFIKAGLKGGK